MRNIKTKKELSLPKMLAKAQRIFNQAIRNRDAELPCITCGKYKIENACHFYSAGQYSALRFHPDNVHGGCVACNYYKHGELGFYRKHIEQRIGSYKLALLDSTATRHRVKRWSRLELELIIKEYS